MRIPKAARTMRRAAGWLRAIAVRFTGSAGRADQALETHEVGGADRGADQEAEARDPGAARPGTLRRRLGAVEDLDRRGVHRLADARLLELGHEEGKHLLLNGHVAQKLG